MSEAQFIALGECAKSTVRMPFGIPRMAFTLNAANLKNNVKVFLDFTIIGFKVS